MAFLRARMTVATREETRKAMLHPQVLTRECLFVTLLSALIVAILLTIFCRKTVFFQPVT